MSVPSSAGNCDLLSVLSDEDKLDLQSFESRLMLSENEFADLVKREGRANIFIDPALRSN